MQMKEPTGERPMRRKDRELTYDEAAAVLGRAEYGVLSLIGDDGAPYGVPLSFVWMDGAVVFHCAKAGYKTDCMRSDNRVSFCAADGVEAVYDDSFTTWYHSAIVAGRAEEVSDDAEKTAALTALCRKYLPGAMGHAEGDIAKSLGATAVWKILPDRITGKAKRPKP